MIHFYNPNIFSEPTPRFDNRQFGPGGQSSGGSSGQSLGQPFIEAETGQNLGAETGQAIVTDQ